MKASLAAATEHQLKVVYLYQFTQFTEWPADVFLSADANFQLCVLGDSLLDDQLKLLKGRMHGSHPIVIRYPVNVQQVQGCHLLYIPSTALQYESEVFKRYKNTALLTVSSQPNFVESGGVVGFVVLDNRLRLKINRAAALNANIKLSAKLLEVAVSIIDNPARELLR